MIKRKSIIFLLVLSTIVLASCKSYYIPVDNFKMMFKGMDTTDLTKEVSFRGPSNEKLTYKTYPIDAINCIDNKGNTVVLENTPSLKIEVVYSGYESSVLLFQSIRVNDGKIIGWETIRDQTYYDALSPVNTRIPGDTLDALNKNRVVSSFYVHGNANDVNNRKEIPMVEIRKISVVKR